MSSRFPALHEIIALVLTLIPFVFSLPAVHYQLNEDGTFASFSYLEPIAVSLGAFGAILVFGNVLILNQSTRRDRRLHIAALIIIGAIGVFQVVRGLGFGLDPSTILASMGQ